MYTLNAKCKAYSHYKYGVIDSYYDAYEVSKLIDCRKGLLYYGRDGLAQCLLNTRLQKHKIVCNINPMKDCYQIDFERNELTKEDDDIWLSIHHSYNEQLGYQINKGDVIKFGAVIFTVSEIGYEINTTQDILIDLSSSKVMQSNEDIDNSHTNINLLLQGNQKTISNNNLNTSICSINGTKAACRVCLEDNNTSDNPLVSPCNCKGSIKYLHLDCIRKMIQMKRTQINTSVCFYIFTSLFCELCKGHYMTQLYSHNKMYQLYDIQRPEGKYIIFVYSMKNKEIYIVVKFHEDTISIGKTPVVEIPFPDFSISYIQATITYKNGHYYLYDINSKYGTYVKLPKKFHILPYHKLTIRINHFFYTFTMKKTIYAYFTCYYPKSLIYKSYNEYFFYLTKQKERSLSKYLKGHSDKKVEIKSLLLAQTPTFLLKTTYISSQLRKKPTIPTSLLLLH